MTEEERRGDESREDRRGERREDRRRDESREDRRGERREERGKERRGERKAHERGVSCIRGASFPSSALTICLWLRTYVGTPPVSSASSWTALSSPTWWWSKWCKHNNTRKNMLRYSDILMPKMHR